MLFKSILLFLCSLQPLVHALTYRAADISSILVVEDGGITYSYENGTEAKFEDILAANGMNTARIRVWTSGTYDLTYALKLGKRVKDAGLRLHIDLHYSDTWADPGHQAIPSSWPTDLDGLNAEIYDYTMEVVQSFLDQGTPIDILQIGNEINNGLLWPVGEISENGFSPASQLLHSAIQGAKATGENPTILIHLANGWDWSGLEYFFGGIFISGALELSEVDMMGVSFYPFYGTDATLANLSISLTNLVNEYGRTVVVAETDWPVSCPGVNLSDTSIPISVAGQAEWVADIRSVLESLPDSMGQGIYYWEPGWVGNAALGSSCSNNLLVTSSGEAEASISMFSRDM
ncbi:glycoside hydrolase family 53 protein [Laetiporus sulphureus 93-53]|uniref:Arabinogalactan endo-beta-1,4-galactanase n=1 Tax=Laetiporus sulphureus 93-53 TaxID=1314785 RepID=A0A165DUJ3_9APHY|nr:glycoside hydrolase family 53 protein [Laetiporus sulphureus 93-53]KZT05654.1 glycoside hydrolase family 53 protein [Laetiporus sulphureus 93-53]